MTNLFKVRLNKESEDFEQQFQYAFNDIYSLAEKLYTSKNKVVMEYLKFMDDQWLTVNDKSIQVIVDGYVTISKDDALHNKQIEYDFGKRLPTDDAFIFAIMSIFYQHVPGTEFYQEVDVYDDCFDDGVILARLVNKKIKNPFITRLVPVAELKASQHVTKIYRALSSDKASKKKVCPSKRAVRFY